MRLFVYAFDESEGELGFMFEEGAIGADEEVAKDGLREDELGLIGEFGVVRTADSAEDKNGALVLLLHIYILGLI